MNIAANSVTLLLAVGALFFASRAISRNRARRIVQRSFRRTVMPALLQDDPRAKRWRIRRLLSKHAKARAKAVVMGDRTAGIELEWLRQLQVALRPHPAGQPFLFLGPDRARAVDRSSGRVWSQAYRAYAAELESRVIFASTPPPVLADEAARARAAAGLVANQAAGVPQKDALPVVFPSVHGDLHLHSLRPKAIKDDAGPKAERPVDVLATFSVSARPDHAVAVPEQMSGFEYDGSLPWLEEFRLERDEASGRYRVHFSCTSRRWSEFQALNRQRKGIAPFSEPDGLLTLNLAAVDAEDRLLLTRRGKYVSGHPDKINSTVTGNLELQTRRGVLQDLDANGIPDITLAMAREAHEELGLSLNAEQVHLVNLSRMWTATDRGTWMASYVATLTQGAGEIADRVRYADPWEGTWEVGDDLYAVTVPESLEDVGSIVRSLDQVVGGSTPHALISFLVVAALRGHVFKDVLEAALADTSVLPLEAFAERYAIRHPFGVKHPR